MHELEITFQRLASIVWLVLWRGTLGGFLAGAVAGALAGVAAAIAQRPELGAVAGGFAGLAVLPFWWFVVINMALKKRYADFRIALVPKNSSTADVFR
jgi:hypothetical protein